MYNFLEKAHSYKSYYDLRQEIIIEFRLHILDRMTYNQFKTIYDKYGKDIKDSDFARIIFDVDYIQFQKVKRGDHGSMTILSFEYYIENDFWRIRNTILEKEKEIFDYGLNYEKVQMLYEKYGEKFSLEMFAEHVLGIHGKTLAGMKIKSNQRINITDINLDQITYIQGIREKICLESKAFIGNVINYGVLHELYKKYCPKEIIDERTFAICILAIKDDVYSKMSNNHNKKTIIFSNYPINPEQLVLLRRKIINENKFIFLQQLSVDEIDRFYRDNGSIYSKSIFLQEVFDINPTTYTQASLRKHNISILSDSRIEPYIEELQRKICDEEGLKISQLISTDRIQKIYEKYGDGFERKYFLIQILGVSYNQYYQMTKNGTTRIFTNSNKEKINLNRHRNPGVQLSKAEAKIRRERLQSKQEKTQREKKTLRKRQKSKEKTSKTKLIDIERIKTIREHVIEKYFFHNGDFISIYQFENIYIEFGDGIDKKEFAKCILDISNYVFDEKIKNKINKDIKNIKILTKEFMAEEQINNLKKEVRHSIRIDDKNRITLLEFDRLYESTKHTLSRTQFAYSVLGISHNAYLMLNSKKTQKVKVNSIDKEFKIDVTYHKKIQFALSNSLHRRQEIDIDEFRQLYNIYLNFNESDSALSEKNFAYKYLDIKEQQWYSLKSGKKVIILSDTEMSQEDINKLKEEIIREYILYPQEVLYYSELEEMINNTWNRHIMTKVEFVTNILQMAKQQYYSIKPETNRRVIIFSREEGIDKLDLEKIKQLQELINKGKSLYEIANIMWLSIDKIRITIIENIMKLDKAHMSIIHYLYWNHVDIKILAELTKRHIDELKKELFSFESGNNIDKERSLYDSKHRKRTTNQENKERPEGIQNEREKVSEWEKQSLVNWNQSKRTSQNPISKEEWIKNNARDSTRRHSERVIQISNKIWDIKQKIKAAALNAKNGTFITKAELLGKKETEREYTRKKIIEIENAVLSLENDMDVEDIINFFFLCNQYHVYDIAIKFIKFSDLQSKINSWSEDDKTRFREIMDKYKDFFLQKARKNAFVSEDEKKFIAVEKKHVESKIDFLCYIILFSGKLEQDDIKLIHQLCKKYNTYKTDFWFLKTCVNNLNSFINKDDYMDSKKKDSIQGRLEYAAKVYARGLIGIFIRKYKDLSDENINKIAKTTQLTVKEIKELYEEYKKQVGGETVGL